MRNTALKLAAFTLFTIVVTFYLATIIGNITPFAHTYTIHAVYSDATGVLNGDPVKIAGVQVGKVTHFVVSHGEAILDMQIDGSTKLPANVQADIKYRNLLGQRVVDLIVPPDASNELLPDDGTIPNSNTHPALDLSAVFNNLRPLIQSTNPDDINTVTRAVVKAFSGKEDELAGILGNVGALTKTLAGHDQRLARFVTDINKVTRILNHEGGSISTGIQKFGLVMHSLAQVTPTIRSVVDRLNEASGKFGSILARNKANLNQELADLSTVLNVVNRNLGPLNTVAANLKEVLLATARSQSYGTWWNLYVVSLCPELGTGQCTAITSGGG